MQTPGLPDGFGVGEWRVHPSQCRLTREDRTVQVRPKVMDLLVALAKRPGVVVSKDALLEKRVACSRPADLISPCCGDCGPSP